MKKKSVPNEQMSPNVPLNTKTDAAWLQQSLISLLASRPENEQIEFLETLSDEELYNFLYVWELWAHPHQRTPEEDFTTWLIMGGRGCGKTRAGAEWIRSKVESGQSQRIALIGQTLHEVAHIMIEGPSGLLSVSPPGRKPCYYKSERKLVWPNGAEAFLFSAKDPDMLRGAQFDTAWCDELAKWNHPQESWDMLQFGLRMGQRPQQIVTTTPQPIPLLKKLIAEPLTVMTQASSYANRAFLAAAFFNKIVKDYADTTLGQQELDGILLDDLPHALWSRDKIEELRVKKAPPDLDRIVIAVDPPISQNPGADECGIIVAGLQYGEEDNLDSGWHAYILGDHSVQGFSPRAWGERVVRLYHTYQADRVIIETNQGGDMVRTIIHQIDSRVAYKPVFARDRKVTRAEPVSSLYEQGRVHHVGVFKTLENQMCCFTKSRIRRLEQRSPDHVDALVWALTELMLFSGEPSPSIKYIE